MKEFTLTEYWEFRLNKTEDPEIRKQLQALVDELKRIEQEENAR